MTAPGETVLLQARLDHAYMQVLDAFAWRQFLRSQLLPDPAAYSRAAAVY